MDVRDLIDKIKPVFEINEFFAVDDVEKPFDHHFFRLSGQKNLLRVAPYRYEFGEYVQKLVYWERNKRKYHSKRASICDFPTIFKREYTKYKGNDKRQFVKYLNEYVKERLISPLMNESSLKFDYWDLNELCETFIDWLNKTDVEALPGKKSDSLVSWELVERVHKYNDIAFCSVSIEYLFKALNEPSQKVLEVKGKEYFKGIIYKIALEIKNKEWEASMINTYEISSYDKAKVRAGKNINL